MSGKQRPDDLAIFGGAPLFSDVRPIGQLAAPAPARFFELARGCFERRRLSNNGPLVQELEARLATYHGTTHCIAFANAGLALIALIGTLANGRRGEVVLPAFTYAGLPHIVRWAGLTPRFCDVDPDTHTLTAACVGPVLCNDTLMVLGVHQVNSPCPIDDLQALSARRGVALIFDSVHGLGATWRGRRIGAFGRAEVFSLHATKLLNGFEGGYVTTSDDTLASLLQRKRNFGFTGEATIDVVGFNAKLNELHAACALAALDDLPAVIARNRLRFEAFEREFAGVPGLGWVRFPDDEESNFEFPLLVVPASWPLSRDRLVQILRAEGALVRAYYDPPLHLRDDPQHAPLPVAEALAARIVQMPAGERLALADIARLARLVTFLHAQGEAIAARLDALEVAR